MSSWSDRVTSPFQREFGSLWVVADPDEILLAPEASSVLKARGIELVPYRDPVAFRHRYETEIRPRNGDTAHLVHVREDAATVVPWDVLQEARVEALSIAELFHTLDPATVRAIGPGRYDDLWEIVSSRTGMPTMGVTATKDFLLANIYRVVPALIRQPTDFWITAFDLFFREQSLPRTLALHVAEEACLPRSVTVAEATAILSDRAIFLDRAQQDWERFAQAAAGMKEPAADIIPFAVPRIRTSLDSMVLDGTISPTKVETLPDAVPAWMRIGMIADEAAARQLAARRLELLRADIPGDQATHREWLRFAERYAEGVEGWRALPFGGHDDDILPALLSEIDRSFVAWLERSFDTLSSNSYAAAPSIVHQIASHMAHRRRLGVERQALVVVDGLALDQWIIIERRLRAQVPDLLIDTRSSFAWLPTTTGVSRQSIFTGDQPRAFAKTIGSTSPEPGAWRRFWANEGLTDDQVFYAKGLGHPGSCKAIVSGPIADGLPVIGLIIDTVDELLHGETFGKRSIVGRIERWLELGEWDRLITALIDADYQVIVTADHGNVDAVGMGRPTEGSSAEERGERVRIYDSETLRQKSLSTLAGTYILQPGGLPESYRPLFAPSGRAFIPDGKSAVVHGGTSLEEVVVPFVRISRKEKA